MVFIYCFAVNIILLKVRWMSGRSGNFFQQLMNNVKQEFTKNKEMKVFLCYVKYILTTFVQHSNAQVRILHS